MSSWVVHKFGGTSRNAERYRQVAAILRARGEKGCGRLGDAQSDRRFDRTRGPCQSALSRVRDALKTRHIEAVEDLLRSNIGNRVSMLDSDFKDIKEGQRCLPRPKLFRPDAGARRGAWKLVGAIAEPYLNATGIASSWLDAHASHGPARRHQGRTDWARCLGLSPGSGTEDGLM
jgi:hypothetical protein